MGDRVGCYGVVWEWAFEGAIRLFDCAIVIWEEEIDSFGFEVFGCGGDGAICIVFILVVGFGAIHYLTAEFNYKVNLANISDIKIPPQISLILKCRRFIARM
jgi:hypothetical protein